MCYTQDCNTLYALMYSQSKTDLPEQEMTESTRATTFRIPEDELQLLDKLVEAGLARDRTDAVRAAIVEAPKALIARWFNEHGSLPARFNELGKLGDFVVEQMAKRGIPKRVEALPPYFDIVVGNEQLLAARVKNEDGQVIVNASVSWYVSPTDAGTVRQSADSGQAWFVASEVPGGQAGRAAIVRASCGEVSSTDINVHIFAKDRWSIRGRQDDIVAPSERRRR